MSDFDDATLATRWGFGWTPSTDEMMGGTSTVELTVAEEGAEDSTGSLRIEGEILPGFPYPWSGAMLFPGDRPMAPADLSGASELTFWARGDGRQYRVLLFSASGGPIPAEKTFVADAEWSEHRVALADFPGISTDEVTGLCFCAGSPEGTFRLEIDSVGFHRPPAP